MEQKFSLLMSVYARENPEAFDLALWSNLKEQSRRPDEMILVCDGPLTEELDEVIRRYEAAYPDVLKVFRLPENGGLGKALNFGLEKCSHDWVARSDSDDVCDSGRFEAQLEYLREHPEVDILGGCIDEFDTDWKSPARVKRMPESHEEIRQMAKTRNPVNHVTSIFRKSEIESAGSYMHLPYAEDYYLWLRAITNGAKFANLPHVLVHVRIGNGMVQRRGNRAQIASWRTLNRYMLDKGMIKWLKAAVNMATIVGFTCCPNGLRKFVYEKLLRG